MSSDLSCIIMIDNLRQPNSLDESTRSSIRHIFLSPRPSFALMTAAGLLGMEFRELKREIENGSIVAVSTRLGQRVAREEMMALALQAWPQAVIEEALGDDAAAVLPRSEEHTSEL